MVVYGWKTILNGEINLMLYGLMVQVLTELSVSMPDIFTNTVRVCCVIRVLRTIGRKSTYLVTPFSTITLVEISPHRFFKHARINGAINLSNYYYCRTCDKREVSFQEKMRNFVNMCNSSLTPLEISILILFAFFFCKYARNLYVSFSLQYCIYYKVNTCVSNDPKTN